MKEQTLNKKTLISLIYGTIVSALLYALAIKCFIQAEGVNLVANGTAGIAVIIGRLFNNLWGFDQSIVYSICYAVINIPILILSGKYIGKYYTIFTLIQIVTASILNILIPSSLFSFLKLDPVTDLALIALCGGFLGGLGSGVALKCGLSTGGVDTIITYIGMKKNKEVGMISFYINMGILIVGGLLFNEWVAMLYTVIFIFVCGQIINMIYRRTKKRILYIVTLKKDEIVQAFIKASKHGITISNVEGGYSKTKKFKIETVVLENEVVNLTNIAASIDPDCFITIVNVHDVNGRFTMPPIQ